MSDASYADLPVPSGSLCHAYGDRVHLLSYPFHMSVLARLCAEETQQPEVNRLITTLFDALLAEVSSHLLARESAEVATRMQALHPEGVYIGQRFDPEQRVVIVDVARAGILPSHRFYDGLHQVINPSALRQDHVVASRSTDADGKVTGVTLDGSKIGGPIDDATVLFPDPMGATGASIAGVIEHYKKNVGGSPRALAAIHLIVTPEYLRRMTTQFPNLHIFAIRLDRGLSAPDVLASSPGSRWDEEVGLNDQQYIVPGAGGVGEILNNAWI